MVAREEAMRYAVGVVFLASCTMLAPRPAGESPAEPSSTGTREPQENPPDPKPKTRQAPSPGAEIASCANLDAGDLKETIKAKLDCIEQSAK